MAIFAVLPGCAIGSRAEGIASPAPPSLNALDPTIPNLVGSLGNFPPWLPSFLLPEQREPCSLEARLGLARIDQLAGRTEQAEQSFRQLARENPTNPTAQTALGIFLASQARWPAAATQLEKAVALAPNDKNVRNRFAIALARTGKTDRALSEFTRVLGKAQAHYNIGCLAWQVGHRQRAIAQFQQALAITPDLSRAQVMLDRVAAAQRPSALPEQKSNQIARGHAVIHAQVQQPARQSSTAIWPVSG